MVDSLSPFSEMFHATSWISWLDPTPRQAAWNMAADEWMLSWAMDEKVPVLRHYCWEGAPASFGYFQRLADVESWTSVRPLVRRCTGGGLVFHEWDWTYSLAIPPGHPWYTWKAEESYRFLHAWLALALKGLGMDAVLADCCHPIGPGRCFIGAEKHDLLVQGRKVAGAAQRRRKDGLLIQGSLQVDQEWNLGNLWDGLKNLSSSKWGVQWQNRLPGQDGVREIDGLVEKVYANEAYLKRR